MRLARIAENRGDSKSATGGGFQSYKNLIGERPSRAAWQTVHEAADSKTTAGGRFARVSPVLAAVGAVCFTRSRQRRRSRPVSLAMDGRS
jgi:hypothetical protein